MIPEDHFQFFLQTVCLLTKKNRFELLNTTNREKKF